MSPDASGIDLPEVRSYLESERPGLLSGELAGELISGGKSNLTFEIGDGARSWILRRPPLGEYHRSAHDMSREYTVMQALGGSPVPVPEMIAMCTDESVTGAPFFVMSKVDGVVYRDTEATATLEPAAAAEISDAVADTLAHIHAVEPEAVGLAEFGRPKGYLERQLGRWTGLLDRSDDSDIAGMDELRELLVAGMPQASAEAIVHGDYRLDNVIVAGKRIAAVVDWELATLGDPMTDVGMLACYWRGLPRTSPNVLAKGVVPEYGFRSAEELLDRYAKVSGRGLDDLPWYMAFGYFKQAVIREGIRLRFERGETVGPGFDKVGELIEPLVDEALLVVRGG